MKKLNTVKKVVVGGMLVVSMVGGVAVNTVHADSKVPTKVVQQVDKTHDAMWNKKGEKATKALTQTKLLDKVINEKNAKARKAYQAQYNFLMLSECDYKDTKLTKKEYKQCLKALEAREQMATRAVTGDKVDNYMKKTAKLPKKLDSKLTAQLDALAVTDLGESMFDAKNAKQAISYGKYADKVRKQRVAKNKMDDITGAYLAVSNLGKAIEAGKSNQVKKLQNDVVESFEDLGTWK